MDTIKGDHRSVLDDESTHPVPSDKPKKVYLKATSNVQPKRTRVSIRTTNPPSWADVVKIKPSDGSNGLLQSILKQ
jgi:hypothetical protein